MRLSSGPWCSSRGWPGRRSWIAAVLVVLAALPLEAGEKRPRRPRPAKTAQPTPLPAPPQGPVLHSTPLLDTPTEDDPSLGAVTPRSTPESEPPGLGGRSLEGEVARQLARRLSEGRGPLRTEAEQRRRPLVLQVALYAALHDGGRVVLRDAGPAEQFEQALKALAREGHVNAPALAALVSERFPVLLLAPDGWLWRRRGPRYQRLPVGPSPVAAVDDDSGALYASDGGSGGAPVVALDPGSEQWRTTGLRDARSLAASAGVLYALLGDGRLVSYRPGQGVSQIGGRQFPERSQLLAGDGALFVLASRGGSFDLHRMQGGAWDRGGDALATGLRKAVASGETWYALDDGGRLRWGQRGQVQIIEGPAHADGPGLVELWLWGEDALVLSGDDLLYHFSASRGAWQQLSL